MAGRFAHEARAIARLSHPRICALHEMGHQDGVDFLVMEYLEGETLAARLRKGPMPLTAALRTAVEIAGARRCACAGYRSSRPEAGQRHAHGGRREAARLRPRAAPCSHRVRPVAGERCIPQQPDSPGPHRRDAAVHGARTARRNEVDARADIFAFGAVLYEMITGRKAFEGTSQASVISAILSSHPPAVAVLQPLTPPALDQVIENCLAKDRNDRGRAPHDAAATGLLHIHRLLLSAGAARNRRRELLAWTMAAVAGLALVVLWAWSLRAPYRTADACVFRVAPSRCVARNGRSPSHLARRQPAPVRRTRLHGKQLLYTLALDVAGPAQPLANTDGASLPFWSPDSQSVGFFGQGKLKTVDIETGQIRTLADAGAARGGTWNRDDVILFAPRPGAGLYAFPRRAASPRR